MDERAAIVFVDDELANLESLTGSLEERFPDFQILTCANAYEALKTTLDLDKRGQSVSLFISDQIMPEMNGVELLTKISETHPQAKKILLTAYASKAGAIDAINQAGVDRYIEKQTLYQSNEPLFHAVEKLLEEWRLRPEVVLRIPSDDPTRGDIWIKEAENAYELHQSFKLIYRVYVEETKRLSPDKLPVEQRELKEKWDEFDFHPTTRHLVAMQDSRAIGCIRFVDDEVPLEADGFSLKEERACGRYIREASKLMVHPDYRGTELLMGILRLSFHICRQVDSVNEMYLSCLPQLSTLYRKLGFKQIGEFAHTSLDCQYLAMRVDIQDLLHTYKQDPEVKPRVIERIYLPLELAGTRRLSQGYRNPWLGRRLKSGWL
jgi:CheY-like chemotaxis protein